MSSLIDSFSRFFLFGCHLPFVYLYLYSSISLSIFFYLHSSMHYLLSSSTRQISIISQRGHMPVPTYLTFFLTALAPLKVWQSFRCKHYLTCILDHYQLQIGGGGRLLLEKGAGESGDISEFSPETYKHSTLMTLVTNYLFDPAPSVLGRQI